MGLDSDSTCAPNGDWCCNGYVFVFYMLFHIFRVRLVLWLGLCVRLVSARVNWLGSVGDMDQCVKPRVLVLLGRH